MADIKISQLGSASQVNATDVFPESSNGVTYKVPASVLKEFMIGSTSISDIGDGSVTGAISAMNSAVGNKTEKADLTSIFQTGSTATQAITNGTYFYLNGTLVKAKTDIANGATFTLNTNYEDVTAGALNDLLKTEVITLTANTSNNVSLLNNARCCKFGKLLVISGFIKFTTVASTWVDIANEILPLTANITGLTFSGATFKETDNGTNKDLAIRYYNGHVQAYGGTNAQIYGFTITVTLL